MTEADLKRQLRKALEARMPGSLVLRVEDKFTAGIPDIAVTWQGLTGWVEVKYDRPRSPARITDGQVLTLKRLRGLLVEYILTRDGEKFTQITWYDPDAAGYTEHRGFDHKAAADAVWRRLRRLSLLDKLGADLDERGMILLHLKG